MEKMLLLEDHTETGVEWGLAFTFNPSPDEYVRVSSKEEGLRIIESYEQGDVVPYLRASGASH